MKPNCFTRLLLLLSGWRKIKKVDSTQLTDSWITRREAADEAGHVVIGHLVGMKITDVRRDEHGTWRTYFDSDQTQVATQALTVEDQVKFLLGGVAGMEVANCITNADEYQEDLFQAIEVLTVRAPHTVSESVARKIIFRWRRECVTLLYQPICVSFVYEPPASL
jgi:hypothetical protein